MKRFDCPSYAMDSETSATYCIGPPLKAVKGSVCIKCEHHKAKEKFFRKINKKRRRRFRS